VFIINARCKHEDCLTQLMRLLLFSTDVVLSCNWDAITSWNVGCRCSWAAYAIRNAFPTIEFSSSACNRQEYNNCLMTLCELTVNLWARKVISYISAHIFKAAGNFSPALGNDRNKVCLTDGPIFNSFPRALRSFNSCMQPFFPAMSRASRSKQNTVAVFTVSVLHVHWFLTTMNHQFEAF